jgi:hypothetical protein
MQLHHAAYAVSCRHTPMTHAYTGASYSIAARPRHGLNSLTLTSATRTAGPRSNVIRSVDARATGLFVTPVLQLLVLGEAVDRQRFGPRFQERDAVFDLLDLKKKRERKQVHQQFSDIILIAQEEMRRLPSVRTVTIGRSGPNISSVMMSESSGGFSRMVGSMLLQLRINQGLWRQAESLDHVNQSHCQWFGAYRVLA